LKRTHAAKGRGKARKSTRHHLTSDEAKRAVHPEPEIVLA
jgi:hypothetical protein